MAHPTHASMKAAGHRNHAEKLRAHGGSTDEKQDKMMIEKAVHKHERHDHPGKPLTKLKSGGHVKGHAGKARGDRKGRKAHRDVGGGVAVPQQMPAQQAPMGGPTPMAMPPSMPMQRPMPGQLGANPGVTAKRGGKIEKRAMGGGVHKKSKDGGKGNHVNIVVAPGGGDRGAPPMPVHPPMAGPPMPPPRPPMAPPGPPMGGPPPMGAPMGGPPPMGMRARGGKVSYPMHDGAGGGKGRMEKAKAYGSKKFGEDEGVSGDGENKPFTGKERARGGAKC